MYGGADAPDPIYAFWGIDPLATDDGVIVERSLLEHLGHDPDEFAARAADPERRASLFVDVFHKTELRVDAVVDEFPDPFVDLLIPASLAHKIRAGATVYNSESFVIVGGTRPVVHGESHGRFSAAQPQR